MAAPLLPPRASLIAKRPRRSVSFPSRMALLSRRASLFGTSFCKSLPTTRRRRSWRRRSILSSSESSARSRCVTVGFGVDLVSSLLVVSLSRCLVTRDHDQPRLTALHSDPRRRFPCCPGVLHPRRRSHAVDDPGGGQGCLCGACQGQVLQVSRHGVCPCRDP